MDTEIKECTFKPNIHGNATPTPLDELSKSRLRMDIPKDVIEEENQKQFLTFRPRTIDDQAWK